jgi:dienelactone hydrolase
MKSTNPRFTLFILLVFQFAMFAGPVGAVSGQTDAAFSQVEFESEDGLPITADLYRKFDDKSKPFIVLCHQAGWSRGEYREIAPKLNELGFNCMAIDQRSGGAINDVINETAKRAKAGGKGMDYIDAEQDMIAALKYARQNYASGKLLIWGSSYSSALAIRIAGEHPGLVDGSLSFAPGEYFVKAGKPANWIASSAKKIKNPMFITSAKNEVKNWKSIFDAVDAGDKVMFVPATEGNHGSRALWVQFDDSDDYWKATRAFLEPFTSAG